MLKRLMVALVGMAMGGLAGLVVDGDLGPAHRVGIKDLLVALDDGNVRDLGVGVVMRQEVGGASLVERAVRAHHEPLAVGAGVKNDVGAGVGDVHSAGFARERDGLVLAAHR